MTKLPIYQMINSIKPTQIMDKMFNSGKLSYKTNFSKLSLLALGSLFALTLSGWFVRGNDSMNACTGWPLCDGSLFPSNTAGWIDMVHRFLVAFTGILVITLLVKAWQTQRDKTLILFTSTSLTTLFFAQAFMGSQVVGEPELYMRILHQATAVVVWVVLIMLVVAAGLSNDTVGTTQKRIGLSRDLLSLTKPVVVLLLLVTTFAGMVIGGQSWPSLSLTFWTLLGGFMAAGGSGAINQYIDRKDDSKMQRTQKRPIPDGRLTPGEGLAFGIAMSLASFYIMIGFVNLLAALLTLAGIIYYVVIYSLLLKKTTVQNIVIGGGAGAIPPLVGWAAATGGLNIPSLFLFGIVFMWTPPHFWALALVRQKDYARAGVPMMPVIRGEKETRWQIFLYTIELVALTLLLPVFGLGGGIYLIGALLLGGWLLTAAWKVWKNGGNKLSWKMYRYSSMYLAFLFIVLMADRLLL